MYTENEDKIYFMPGNIVKLRLAGILENTPNMLVIGKVSSMFKHLDGKEKSLKGIKCIWFDKNQVLHEYVFNTKDIEKVN